MSKLYGFYFEKKCRSMKLAFIKRFKTNKKLTFSKRAQNMKFVFVNQLKISKLALKPLKKVNIKKIPFSKKSELGIFIFKTMCT